MNEHAHCRTPDMYMIISGGVINPGNLLPIKTSNLKTHKPPLEANSVIVAISHNGILISMYRSRVRSAPLSRCTGCTYVPPVPVSHRPPLQFTYGRL